MKESSPLHNKEKQIPFWTQGNEIIDHYLPEGRSGFESQTEGRRIQEGRQKTREGDLGCGGEGVFKPQADSLRAAGLPGGTPEGPRSAGGHGVLQQGWRRGGGLGA